MLAMTRFRDQSVTLYTSDGLVEIVVAGCNRVKLLFNAPPAVKIVRTEIDDGRHIEAANKEGE